MKRLSKIRILLDIAIAVALATSSSRCMARASQAVLPACCARKNRSQITTLWCSRIRGQTIPNPISRPSDFCKLIPAPLRGLQERSAADCHGRRRSRAQRPFGLQAPKSSALQRLDCQWRAAGVAENKDTRTDPQAVAVGPPRAQNTRRQLVVSDNARGDRQPAACPVERPTQRGLRLFPAMSFSGYKKLRKAPASNKPARVQKSGLTCLP